MVRFLKNKSRHRSRKNRYYYLDNFADKIVIEKSSIVYAQYFIIPTIFTFVGFQYFRDNNYEPKFLIIIILGYFFSFVANYFIAKHLRKNPEIVINKIGITFSNTRTIFWEEISNYNLLQRNSSIGIYIITESEEFVLEFKHLPISKTKLKVLINSFYKKYNGPIKRDYNFLSQNINKIENVSFDNYLNNTIL
ncbi:hypothetical protein [Epilithonimonas lactis]|uniref:Uncharacterized protein n=1 Tax=Epilithonimonas lactis TaxID=421072 RepID=A0A085BG09_9FLAO|nr:hypothetical protein [Epilithonimonas lactis]KFC21404.1 hypothetical protein IO89_14585 [Epilithonimonas lactis]SEP84152.1 hypothetical protein SAMN04488097_0823 [Epilithonimonas lactis]